MLVVRLIQLRAVNRPLRPLSLEIIPSEMCSSGRQILVAHILLGFLCSGNEMHLIIRLFDILPKDRWTQLLQRFLLNVHGPMTRLGV